MKHHIIVKWNESVEAKAEMLGKVRELFAKSCEIDGIVGAEVIPNCVDRANRYDLMIVIEMDRNSLEKWDESDIHKTWKREYGEHIAQKAIFDCE